MLRWSLNDAIQNLVFITNIKFSTAHFINLSYLIKILILTEIFIWHFNRRVESQFCSKKLRRMANENAMSAKIECASNRWQTHLDVKQLTIRTNRSVWKSIEQRPLLISIHCRTSYDIFKIWIDAIKKTVFFSGNNFKKKNKCFTFTWISGHKFFSFCQPLLFFHENKKKNKGKECTAYACTCVYSVHHTTRSSKGKKKTMGRNS